MAEKHPLEGLPGLGQFGGDQKRIKLEEQSPNQVKAQSDPHNAPPSRVVHARAVPDGCTHQQMVAALTKFGKISYVTMMPRLRQALVEFENIEDAIMCVQTSQVPIQILDRPVFFNFSTSQEITRSPYGIAPSGANTAIAAAAAAPIDDIGGQPPPNHILLFTIFNPLYPITVDVIRTICSPYGFVQRTVIFRKNGLQVLVEFDSNTSAQRAKQQLDGADIYAGCCTLKIEYAKTNRLNVYKNDEMTWDFTAQGRQLQSNYSRTPAQQPLRTYAPNYGAPPPAAAAPPPQAAAGTYNMVGTPAVSNSGSVIMLYGLSATRTNCDTVFNLLCSYGNVLKVKILTNKPGTAMAHMDSPQGARNAIQHLHGHKLLGQNLELNYSRHSYIADYSQGGTLSDGSSCWKDFSQSRNNRFMTAEGTSKNRIVSPGRIMHFYNAPPDSTTETLNELFTKAGAQPPSATKFFSQGGKSSTGLMEWPDDDVALDSFVLTNHSTAYSQTVTGTGSVLPSTGGQAYTFKLAFSSNTSLDQYSGPPPT